MAKEEALAYLRFPDEVAPPGAALPGFCVFRSASMKMNWFGGAQISCVPQAALLTLAILQSNTVPDPFNGVKSFEQADMRSVKLEKITLACLPSTHADSGLG